MSSSKPNLTVIACHAPRSPSMPPEQDLNAQARELFSRLDEPLRPILLAARYPRILNKVAELWRRPTLLDCYFEELLMDTRGNRQGFPLSILLELCTLKEHYRSSAFPTRTGIWDETNLTERFR